MKKLSEPEGLPVSGETALIVHCARLNLSVARTQAIKEILSAGVDWDSLFKSAAWQRLIPLVSHHLRSPELSPFVPKPVMSRLQAIHYQSLARNMLLQDELVRILMVFNKEGIPVILLKGAALLDMIYQDISLRPMADLDILVRPGDLDRAGSLVLGNGYIYHSVVSDNPGVGKHLPNLMHREKGVFIEVHQHIVNANDACYFDISDFWTRARPVRKTNADAFVFSKEDMITHLSIKFLLDRRFQSNAALGQLCDISEVINQYRDSLDWGLISGTARQNRYAAGLYGVLYCCQNVLGTVLPTELLTSLRPRRFDPALMDLFIRRRVLDTRPWLAHNLINHNKPYSRSRMMGAILGRSSRLAASTLGNGGLTGNHRHFTMAKIKDVFLRLFRSILKPSELREDLLLDRWLHDLYGKPERY